LGKVSVVPCASWCLFLGNCQVNPSLCLFTFSTALIVCVIKLPTCLKKYAPWRYKKEGCLISLVHLSAPLCPQAPTLNLLSTCLIVCSILGSRPISFPSLFLLSSPSHTDWLLCKWIGMFLVVFGVVYVVKCPD